MANEQNLRPFKPGKDERRNTKGRPRKLVNAMKIEGYSASEVNDCMMIMLAMSLDELKNVFENKNSTVLEKAIASAVKRSIERGSLFNIETVLTRSLGKPKETVDATINGAITSKIVTVEVQNTGVPLADDESQVEL